MRWLAVLLLTACGGGDPGPDCRFKPDGADALEQAQWVELCREVSGG